METTREFTITPAFDKRDSNPHKNYGTHGCDLRMIVKGQHGAIQFVLHTNWHLPHVEKEMDAKIDSRFPHLLCHPQPADVGYHSKVPMYEGATPVRKDCQYTGGECYYDGSGLRAEEWYNVLVAQGSEAVWKLLEEEYDLRFGSINPAGDGI